MNEMVNKRLLPGDTFTPEMHLKQAGFTYSTCGPCTKNKERIQKFKEPRESRYNYRNELDKTCFWHNMASEEFEDLLRTRASDKVLPDKAFNIQNMDDIKEALHGLRGLASCFLLENMSNEKLAEKLHKPIIRKLEKCQLY